MGVKRLSTPNRKSTPKSKNRKAAPKKRPTLTQRLALTALQPGLDDVINIPATSTFNKDLRSASERTMLALLGVPGRKTKDCSGATGTFKSRVVAAVNVGPFKVTGLDVAVASLKAVFAEAKAEIPHVVSKVKTEGMLCVRHKRANPNSFSNHSWGAAIDLFFGRDVVPQGVKKTHRGILMLAPFFNKHGWYWGAGFSGKAVDSMHFELAEQTIRRPPPGS
jgi:D-alanyl-D-alanine carboxypeptidase